MRRTPYFITENQPDFTGDVKAENTKVMQENTTQPAAEPKPEAKTEAPQPAQPAEPKQSPPKQVNWWWLIIAVLVTAAAVYFFMKTKIAIPGA